MRILTLEDRSFEMNAIPDEVDDLRFAVLDNSNPEDPDYFFVPMIYMESFDDDALVLDIDGCIIRVPWNWKILIGEKEFGDLEMLNLTSLNERGFNAFSFNPLSSYSPDYLPVRILDWYKKVRWYFPKLKQGQILAIPIETGESPRCVYFAKDINRQSEVIDISKAW